MTSLTCNRWMPPRPPHPRPPGSRVTGNLFTIIISQPIVFLPHFPLPPT